MTRGKEQRQGNCGSGGGGGKGCLLYTSDAADETSTV